MMKKHTYSMKGFFTGVLATVLAVGLLLPAGAVEAAHTLQAGYTAVKVDGNIDFFCAHLFHDGLMPVSEIPSDPEAYDKLVYLNTQGKLMRDMPCDGYAFSEGLAPFLDDDTWALGYMDTTGKTVIPATLEVNMGMGQTLVGRFVDGTAPVFHRTGTGDFGMPLGTWSQIDRTGKAVPTTLDMENPDYFCHEGGDNRGVSYSTVSINGKDHLLAFSEGYALVNLSEDPDNHSQFYVISNLGVPTSASAAPAASTVLVDGKSVAFDAYVINQNNYFKLRDFAHVVSGTQKEFDVLWNQDKAAIEMITGTSYTVVGGELQAGDDTAKTAARNTAPIYLDAAPVGLTAYTIGGNNYFKLRDLCKAFDISVGWDGATGTVTIDTTRSYVAE